MDNLQIYKREERKLLIGYLLVLVIQIALVLIYRKAEITFSFKDAEMNGLADIFAGLEAGKDGAFLVGQPLSFTYMMSSTLGLEKLPAIFGVDIITLALLLIPFYDIVLYLSSKGLKRYRNLKTSKKGLGIAIICFVIFLLSAFVTAQKNKTELGGLTFSFNALGHMYWIFLIVQLILVVKFSKNAEYYLDFRVREETKAKDGE